VFLFPSAPIRTSNSYWLTGWSAGISSALHPISETNWFYNVNNGMLALSTVKWNNALPYQGCKCHTLKAVIYQFFMSIYE
jgi:hypothetical protein